MSVDRLIQLAQRAPFAVVIVAPILASGFGLVAVGHGWLGLEAWAGLLVPLTLDAAALSFAFLSWQATAEDEAAGLERLLVWVFAAASAGLNMWHADAVGGLHGAAFFGFASLTAALVWERMLHALQRRTLRELGRVDKRAPRFRFLRWLLFPVETAGAFRFAVGEGVSDPRAAIESYRHRNGSEAEVPAAPATSAGVHKSTFTQKQESPKSARPAAKSAADKSATAVEVAPELAGLTKRDAVRNAFDAVGAYSGKGARDWLASRGVDVDKSYAARLARECAAAAEEESTSPRRLVAVGDDR